MNQKLIMKLHSLISSIIQKLLVGISSVLALFLFQFCSKSTVDESYNSPLKLMFSIPLQNVNGRIDHMAYNPKRNLVYVAALGNNTVEIADLKNHKVTHTITGFSEPQGIRYISRNNIIVIANGNSGDCDVFNADSYQKYTTINLGNDADNVRYDSTTNRVYCGYGDGGIAVIDAAAYKQLADVKLSGHPESFQLDDKKIYVNVPETHQIEVVNLENSSVEAQWKVDDASSNFPMALDKSDHRLFVGCRNPAKLLVIDTETGKTITMLDIDSDTDDVFYDSSSKQIYVSCGGGYVDIIKQIDGNNYEAVSKIVTSTGARTSLFIPELNQLIVAVPAQSGNDAQLIVYGKK